MKMLYVYDRLQSDQKQRINLLLTGFFKGPQMSDKDYIRSIEKCFVILDCLNKSDSLLTLEEIIQRTGYKKTTCFRLVKTMLDLGILERAASTKTYQFGYRLIQLGSSALKNMNLRKSAVPSLRQLRDETGETVNLGILSGSEVLFVERIMSDYLVNININVGDRLPLHISSMGKVMLAFLSEENREKIIPQMNLLQKTDRTIVTEDELRQEIETIRKRGYAINDEEIEKGLRTVAAPIINYTGEAFAAINIAWLIARHPKRSVFTEFGAKVVKVAEQISRSMGYSPK